MNKISIILGVLLLVAASAAGYFYWQGQQYQNQPIVQYVSPTPTSVPTTQDETVNWKTYSNSKLGFELKYPPGWFVAENSDNVYITPKKPTPDQFPPLHGIPGAFTILDYSDSQWHKDFTQKLMLDPRPIQDIRGQEYSRVEKIILSGIEAVKTIQYGEADMATVGGYRTDIYVLNSGHLLDIFYPNQYNKSYDHRVYDQILSTIRFTNI